MNKIMNCEISKSDQCYIFNHHFENFSQVIYLGYELILLLLMELGKLQGHINQFEIGSTKKIYG